MAGAGRIKGAGNESGARAKLSTGWRSPGLAAATAKKAANNT